MMERNSEKAFLEYCSMVRKLNIAVAVAWVRILNVKGYDRCCLQDALQCFVLYEQLALIYLQVNINVILR